MLHVLTPSFPTRRSSDLPILDFALANNKPFAVVPCCVYSRCFPKRVDENGKPVRSYDEFIQYLKKKDDSICSVQLDFEGKNELLYSLKGYSDRKSTRLNSSH